MLSPSEVTSLLSKLCSELGFCLEREHGDRLRQEPPETATEFAHAVIEAEGLSAELLDRQLYRQVLTVIEQAFARNGSA